MAGFAGVAATGVLVARSERRRRAYTPDEIRAQLHARADSPPADAQPADAQPADAQPADAQPAELPSPLS
ncbi:MAG: hypothetical protein H7269_06220 [Cellulomonas sp.]|nr:hypothetical protein [Cellulomonas sp.]